MAIEIITEMYGDFKESEYCKIYDNEDFGYSRITIEEPKKMRKEKFNTIKKANLSPIQN